MTSTTVTGSQPFQSCSSQYSTNHEYKWEDDNSVPRNIVFVRRAEHCDGGLRSDTRVAPGELDHVSIVSILTEDDYGTKTGDDFDTIRLETPQAKEQEQGVKRVVEALKSFQIRRLVDSKKANALSPNGIPETETPTAAKQQHSFSSPQRQQKPGVPNALISGNPANRVKGEKNDLTHTRASTPGTTETTPAKSVKTANGDEKGLASLRRFALNFRKNKQQAAPSPPEPEPGLAKMGEEDTVQ